MWLASSRRWRLLISFYRITSVQLETVEMAVQLSQMGRVLASPRSSQQGQWPGVQLSGRAFAWVSVRFKPCGSSESRAMLLGVSYVPETPR